MIDRGSLLYAFFPLLSPSPLSFWYNVVFFFQFSFLGNVGSYLIAEEFFDVTKRFIYFFLFLILCSRDLQDNLLYHLEIHLIRAHLKRLLIKVNNLLIT